MVRGECSRVAYELTTSVEVDNELTSHRTNYLLMAGDSSRRCRRGGDRGGGRGGGRGGYRGGQRRRQCSDERSNVM